MNITEAFRDWLNDRAVASSGHDLFISRAPSGPDVPDSLWWLRAQGGTQQQVLATGEVMQNNTVLVYYRDPDPQQVYDKLAQLTHLLNADGPCDLDGFTVITVGVTGPFTDQDINAERREVGMIQVTIKTYDSRHAVIGV